MTASTAPDNSNPPPRDPMNAHRRAHPHPPRRRRRPSASRRIASGLLAGVAGAAAVDLAGRAGAALGDIPRRPTLPAQLIAALARVPDAGSTRRHQGPTRRAVSTLLRLETPTGPDVGRIQQVGTAAHYLWGAGWGVIRVGLGRRSGSGDFSTALTHFLVFAATDHTVLAITRVGTPIWAHHEPPDNPYIPDGSQGDTSDAALQLAQLALYIAITNISYVVLRGDR